MNGNKPLKGLGQMLQQETIRRRKIKTEMEVKQILTERSDLKKLRNRNARDFYKKVGIIKI